MQAFNKKPLMPFNQIYNLNLRRTLGAAVLLVSLLGWVSCKKEVVQQEIYDQAVYGIHTAPVYQSNLQKTRQKSADQFISILYADLFNQSISNQELNELAELNQSIGDKGLANEMVLNKMLTLPGLVMPTSAAMRADLDSFVLKSYVRFYLRYPSAYEQYFMTHTIGSDAAITPEMVYESFILSNEYMFY